MVLTHTAEAIKARAAVPDHSARGDLLTSFQVGALAPIAAKALNVVYHGDPEQMKFDALAKVKWPPSCKQLYWHPIAGERRDLLDVSRWPKDRVPYPFPAYPVETIRSALHLQPGPSALAENDRGWKVGPDRQQLMNDAPAASAATHTAAAAPGASESAAVTGHTGADDGQVRGRGGKRSRLGKRGRQAQRPVGGVTDSLGSGGTGDTSLQETSSRRQRTS